MSSSKSRSGFIAIAIATIIGLLGFSGYLLYKNNNLKQLSEQQILKIDESERLKLDLDKQYYQSLSELEEMRGNNEELNALIEKQKDELKEKKGQISRLIANNKQDLRKAKSEMEGMRLQLSQYVSELNTLKKANLQLENKAKALEQDKKVLKQDLDKKNSDYRQLVSDKAILEGEKDELTGKAARLGEKVDIASAIKITEVVVTGWKIKSSGKAVKKKYAKNIQRLDLCFATLDNAVVPAGEEEFYIRIISPLGETLAVEELGSGVLTDKTTQEQLRYTKTATISYENEAGNFCTSWEPTHSFEKGIYNVEVYNKGYLSGKGDFRLK